MNILFVSLSSLPHLDGHSISLDLIHELTRNHHNVYVLCSNERRTGLPTSVSEEAGCRIVRVRTGNLTKVNLIEKGISTLLLPRQYIAAIKKYFSDVKFDLILYPTPPVTFAGTVHFVKKRDGSQSYLMLKDIFPQNAVDLGMMSTSGLKGLMYRYFRREEKRLYTVSDKIGCMSQANVDYLLKHNPDISADRVEIFPNCIEIQDMSVSPEERVQLREKYSLPQDKKIFVYGGNLGKPQGIPFIIECLKKLAGHPDAYFLVVGNGTEFGKLQHFFDEEKPENMQLLHHLPKEDYDRLVAACDVGLIFLDHRFTIPNFPSRLLAYMQAGLPVLAATDPNTDIGQVITEGGFGWWCESNDVHTFAALVDTACAADAENCKAAAHAYLQAHYNVETQIGKIIHEK